MKRIMISLAFGLIMVMSLTSCVTPDAVVCDEPTADVVIRYGTPYYYNGTRWYYYKDTRPVRHHRHGWVNPGTRRPHKPHGNPPHDRPGTVKPNHGGHGGHSGGHVGRPSGNRPNGGGHHGGNGGRPSTPRRR